MSFVLNALRRAEAERARGTVPDVHAQALPALGATAARRPRVGLWIGAGLGALLVLALVAMWMQRAPTTGPAAPAVVAGPQTSPGPVALPTMPTQVPPQPPPPPPVLIRIEAPPAPKAKAARAPAEASPQDAVVRFQDLPEAQRRQMPALQFGGAMDSSVASSRMLIVNGQVLREGDQAAPGVVLERIALRAAIVRFKGQRIEMSY